MKSSDSGGELESCRSSDSGLERELAEKEREIMWVSYIAHFKKSIFYSIINGLDFRIRSKQLMHCQRSLAERETELVRTRMELLRLQGGAKLWKFGRTIQFSCYFDVWDVKLFGLGHFLPNCENFDPSSMNSARTTRPRRLSPTLRLGRHRRCCQPAGRRRWRRRWSISDTSWTR